MNAFLRKSLGISICLLASSSESFSQLDWSKYEIGFTGGIFIYQGDLTPERLGSYKTPGWNFNLFVNRLLSSKFSIRGNLAAGRLKGDDSAYSKPGWRQYRNFSFQSTVWEFSALAVYKLLQRRKFAAYVFGGAGISKLNTSRDWSRFNSEFFSSEPGLHQKLEQDIAQKLPRFIPVVPVGAGVEYSLTERLSLLLETNYRLTSTDYLDGFSKAGNPSGLDHYQSHSLGVKYRFEKKSAVDCPVAF